jgi:adenosylcobyric acid synthase
VIARPLFVGGTSSNAGKSFVVTAICASLRRQGIAVAPFKAQNMSNNSFPCRDGGEIGRAQVAQAQASGLEPETAMNPILLKPNGDGTSQVVVRGRVWKTLSAREYYEQFDVLLAEVLAAYEDLARRFDVVVIEGAGSVSELNLRQHDLVNLGLVTRLDAPWVLVADIERGGVFASVIGTVSLLTPEERGLFRGFLINKFRGDRTLFESGAQLLESKTGAPCLGVFPYADDIRLDAEDSLALDTRRRTSAPPGARIAIVRFPRVSNATDFRLLTWADWIDGPAADHYDFIILPGSKQTLADLAWLRARRLDTWIVEQQRRGSTVIGVCGGLQMLGDELADPQGVESPETSARGLGLLPATTVMARSKTTRVRRARTPGGVEFDAYEIHLGVTTSREPLPPFAVFDDGAPEGFRAHRVMGTYLHGSFENAAVCAELFGVTVAAGDGRTVEHQRLADWLDSHCRQPNEWLPVARRL